jgi:hypothetical protein
MNDFIPGLIVAGIGFVVMLVGRYRQVAARLKQDKSAMRRANIIVLIATVISVAGFALVFWLPYWMAVRIIAANPH